jgi:hypothetical protein
MPLSGALPKGSMQPPPTLPAKKSPSRGGKKSSGKRSPENAVKTGPLDSYMKNAKGASPAVEDAFEAPQLHKRSESVPLSRAPSVVDLCGNTPSQHDVFGTPTAAPAPIFEAPLMTSRSKGPRCTLHDSLLKQLIAEVAEALHEMHSRNMVHLDVKPANILMQVDGIYCGPLSVDGEGYVVRGD